jgi:hypothetical protein
MVKIFISHSTKDKQIASLIKTRLEDCGQEAFVAHDDIQVANPWREEIKRYLRECDAMVVLVTPESMGSYWVHQEIGSAMIRSIPIIPIKDGTDPLGFLGDYQAAPLKKKYARSLNYGDCTKTIVYTLLRDKSCSGKVRRALIDKVEKSSNYSQSEFLFDILADVPMSEYWTPDEVEEILRNGLLNNQVYGAFIVKKYIVRLINDNRGSLNPAMIEKWGANYAGKSRGPSIGAHIF